MITDADGDILYTDRSIKVGGALRLFASAAAKSSKRGIVYYNGRSVYTKEIALNGERLRFFTDSQNLCEILGIEESVLGNEMFEIPKSFKNRAPISLKSLVRLFADAYSDALFSEGIHMSVSGLLVDQTVNVSPSALALCLAIMVRLTADDGSTVTLTLANEYGRVSIYADSTSGAPVKTKATKVLETMLYEASAAAGFKVEESVRNSKRTFSIALEPLDISMLGFKAPSLDRLKTFVKIYVEMFL